MEEREIIEEYAIPANYTDSGKIFGGLLAPRNLIEALIIVGSLGYLEMMIFSGSELFRMIFMCITLMPIAIFSLMGIDGDSLCQYFGHIIGYLRWRRKLHFKKTGDENANSKVKEK